MTNKRILYTREEHGNLPVIVYGNRERIELVSHNETLVFDTAQKFLRHVTGTDNWSFDRYFRIGKYKPKNENDKDVLKFFNIDETEDPIEVIQAQGLGNKGIDLVNRADEVAKLLFAGFGDWIRSAGYEPEEVLQEVYKGLLVRNMGKCPWDEEKSSFGHYVHMVCRGVMSNYHRKQKKVRENESVGVMGFEGGERKPQDVGSAGVSLPAPPTSYTKDREMHQAMKDLLSQTKEGKGRASDKKLAKQVLPMLVEGKTRVEMSEALGTSKVRIAKAVKLLRQNANRMYH